MQRRSVLLPEPLGPMRQTTSPAATDRLTPSRARTAPKCLWRILFVAHTEREDRLRIISARRAARQEQEQYEEGIDEAAQ